MICLVVKCDEAVSQDMCRRSCWYLQRIDFNKLDTIALKRYRRIHKLDDVGPNPTKEELVSAVGRHFTAQASKWNQQCPVSMQM